ncbi:hypothetical protein LSTR_LSTR005536 [Laodelphax striatellus]|uniref:Uncharacterized protein n=1 Tax=Laodelphax striatellus TaxID=195883 RepID=A0A482WXD0_LAOST|nr:hypothetical protein LSTR_LSTR005536 [Laodelphax striatellus]
MKGVSVNFEQGREEVLRWRAVIVFCGELGWSGGRTTHSDIRRFEHGVRPGFKYDSRLNFQLLRESSSSDANCTAPQPTLRDQTRTIGRRATPYQPQLPPLEGVKPPPPPYQRTTQGHVIRDVTQPAPLLTAPTISAHYVPT